MPLLQIGLRFYLRAVTATVGLLVAGPMQPSAQAAVGASVSCDANCLTGVLDQYLDGLVNHDVKRVPLAKNVRFSENNVMLKPGDAVWGTNTGIQHQKDIKFADPQTGAVGYFGMIEEHGKPNYIALRMNVRDHKIVEVESLFRRPEPGPAIDGALYYPDPLIGAELPVAQRTPRARMIELAVGYFKTLELNDGKVFTEFDDDCKRWENGRMTAGPASSDAPDVKGCLTQMKLGVFRRITRARLRDTLVVDEAKGLVLSRAFLDHAGVLTEYPLTDGTTMSAGIHTVPQTWCVLELFKIRSGKIVRISAVMIGVPYNIPSPWTAK